MTWTDAFIFNAESILPLIIQNKGNIIRFLIDCYEDIMNVLEILWQLDVYHNDLHGRNLLIDIKTFQCYVIDLNVLFYEMFLVKKKKQHLFYCFSSTCSPVHWYYVQDRKSIVRHNSQNITARWDPKQRRWINRKPIYKREEMRNILSKFAMYSKQYEIAVRIFHTFVRLYYLQIHKENDILFEI
eukprot:506075_1